MDVYNLVSDIKVFYVKADKFPEGITDAHRALHERLPSLSGREFFGISYSTPHGDIIYKAAVEETYPGEAEEYGCDSFIIHKGIYVGEMVPQFWKDISRIQVVFQKLLKEPRLDPEGFCLEVYISESDVMCMVRLDDQHHPHCN